MRMPFNLLPPSVLLRSVSDESAKTRIPFPVLLFDPWKFVTLTPSTGYPMFTGDPITGDPITGDPVTGNPVNCDPITCTPVTCDPVTCDPGTGNPSPVKSKPDTCWM